MMSLMKKLHTLSMQKMIAAIMMEAISTITALFTTWVFVGQEVLYRNSV